ncbi:helix-turn-helix domain-containing protein [Pectinatus sottacetonis]|uniref:helix-turn-helix domain-containing protein n=1 Tax=Pectinatus sottacetonis TaxID=1002795 RepID=UPI0018C6866C|nr:helix-turn-helix transcriptional regulator [Pectinatus sottacetonis]
MKTTPMKIARLKVNMKQKDVAKILGISRSTFSNYETARYQLPAGMRERLAEIYKCNKLDLI